jgi:hypothetical protein
MILFVLGQAHTVLVLDLSLKGLISFRDSIFYINTSSFSHPGMSHNKSLIVYTIVQIEGRKSLESSVEIIHMVLSLSRKRNSKR